MKLKIIMFHLQVCRLCLNKNLVNKLHHVIAEYFKLKCIYYKCIYIYIGFDTYRTVLLCSQLCCTLTLLWCKYSAFKHILWVVYSVYDKRRGLRLRSLWTNLPSELCQKFTRMQYLCKAIIQRLWISPSVKLMFGRSKVQK